jgi:hypothetical protein
VARYVYSTPFIQYTSATPNNQYEVPLGYVAIVRQITVQQNEGAYSFFAYTQDSPEAPGLVFAADESAGFYNYAAWEGRVVVPGGGIITIETSTVFSSLNSYVGGYLLNDAGG